MRPRTRIPSAFLPLLALLVIAVTVRPVAAQSLTDFAPVVSAPSVANAEEEGTLTITVTASDPNGDPIDSLTANLSELPAGNDAVFTPAAGNTSGTLVWHPQLEDAGDYHVIFTAKSTTLSGQDTTYIGITAFGADANGTFSWTPQSGQEGTYYITFTATDVGGTTTQTDTLNISAPITAPHAAPPAPIRPIRPATESPERAYKGPIIQGSTTISGTTTFTMNTTVSATSDPSTGASAVGTRLSARIVKAGSLAEAVVTLTCDTSGLPAGNDATFTPDEQPNVTSPGMVTASPGAPLTVLVTAVDPDGDAIESLTADTSLMPSGNPGSFTAGSGNLSGTFSWTPGLGDAGSTYSVMFVATNRMVGAATTTIEVSNAATARIFVKEPVYLNLGSNRDANCLYIEPISDDFSLSDVDLSTIRLISVGTGAVSEIGIIPDKTVVIADRDNNHVSDLAACFAKADLRSLFSLVTSKSVHTVTIRGQLTSGAFFEGTAQITVIANGPHAGAASIAPNPLNPQAKLSLTLGKGGWLKISLYDAQGRLVRVLADETHAVPGPRDIMVDGTDMQGRPLASGVYYYKVQSADGVTEGKLAIVR